MTMARWERTIVDARGRPVPGASVEVRREDVGLPLEPLFSDRDGTTPLANPFTADGNGLAAFHCRGGAFRIVATSGAFSQTLRYQKNALGAEFDGPIDVAPQGTYDGDTAYAKNDIVSDQGGSWIAKQATTGNAPPTLPTSSNDYWLLLAGPGAAGAPGAGITDNAIVLEEISTPSAPSSGSRKAYFKADGKLYALASTGAEQPFAQRDVEINAQTGTTYTLAASDAGKEVTVNNGSPITVTVPTDTAVPMPVGTQIVVRQIGAGIATIDGDTGVTVNGVSGGAAAITARYQGVVLLKVATDTWICSGAIGTFA